MVLPELEWTAKASPGNPSSWVKPIAGPSRGASQQPQQQPPAKEDGVGGAWNADALLPIFGSGLLACPALPRDMLDLSARWIIGQVAVGAPGWGGLQAQLEDCVLRAGGGNSLTGTRSRAGAASVGDADANAAGSGVGVAQGAAAAAMAKHSADVLTFLLQKVLAAAAQSTKAPIKACAAGLYRSLIPLLSPAQVCFLRGRHFQRLNILPNPYCRLRSSSYHRCSLCVSRRKRW
jgi:hypothetical protein